MRIKDLFETNDNNQKVLARVANLFGKEEADDLEKRTDGVTFMRDRQGRNWKIIKTLGNYSLEPDYMMEDASAKSMDFKAVKDLLTDLAMFMSMNTMAIKNYAKDSASAQELSAMQAQFSKPVFNGKTYFDVIGDMKLLRDPKFIAEILKWVHGMLVYIEPRIKKFVADDKKTMFLNRLETLKNKYKGLVS